MKKVKDAFKLSAEELAALRSDISRTRNWLILSGIVALIIFGGMAVVGVAGFFIGLIELTAHPAMYPPSLRDMVLFVLAGVIGISFSAICIWLGAAALLTAAKAKEFMVTGSADDLLAYNQRLRRVFATIGGIAIFGIAMCVLAAFGVLVAFMGVGMAMVD